MAKKNFHTQINRFANKTKMRMGHFWRGVLIKLFSLVVFDTPVGNVDTWNISDAQKKKLREDGYVGGQLRGGWQTSIGKSSRKKIERIDPNGGTVIAEMTGIVSNSKDADPIYFVNRVPYAARIEYDGWSHTKAPEGMVRKNVRRARALVRKQLAQTKAEIK